MSVKKERAAKEIAIHLSLGKERSSSPITKKGQSGLTCDIGKLTVKYKDEIGWHDANPISVRRLPKPIQILGVQTITLVEVKQNPCYITIWIRGKPVLVQVPCPK